MARAVPDLFEHRAVDKTYWALAPLRDDLTFPVVVRNHLRKERGSWQAEVVPGRPGQRGDADRARVEGRRSRHLPPDAAHGPHPPAARPPGRAGIPIVDDPLYPEVRDVEVDDFSSPLQLLAGELAFTDPVDGSARRFRSVRRLPLTAGD